MTGHEHTYTAELEARITALMVQRDRMRERVEELEAQVAAAREAAAMAFRRTWAFHIDIDGIPEEYGQTFLDRFDKEMAERAK